MASKPHRSEVNAAPEGALGFPDRSAALDLLPGFHNPPPGYGSVPFYWWTGDPLTRERLTWQLDQLAGRSISGLQINLATLVGGGGGYGMTYPTDPPLFSDDWWELWSWTVGAAKARGMALGLSEYNLSWIGNGQWVDEILTDPEFHGQTLWMERILFSGGPRVALELPPGTVAAVAYPSFVGELDVPRGVYLGQHLDGGTLTRDFTAGQWELLAVTATAHANVLDPMNPQVGAEVVRRHYQRFDDHCPGESGTGMSFFFQDELMFGAAGPLWTARFVEEFRARKGYDILPLLPALFVDIGPRTPKVRLDYWDVLMSLSEEGYFKPIFDWHWERGMLYGCDQCSRGLDPSEFGDYFRAVRWFSAPGHDTPGVGADLIKGKVSSSISHLYERPRVWLEGYHSAGWGMGPAAIVHATQENYLYGCNLLTLHGLYYTTHGSFWEWAPPCYHFRMPYWAQMGTLMRYFERLSYALSQGVHCCDVAILYPVAAGDADESPREAVQTAFSLGRSLFQHGIDFDYIDWESLERAEVDGERLRVAGECYRVLILPAMAVVRHSTMERALEFYRAGGMVVAVGPLPEASDRVGRDDPKLDAMVTEVFGLTGAQARAAWTVAPRTSAAKGVGLRLPADEDAAEHLLEAMDAVFTRDFRGPASAQVLHRKAGTRDLYYVMGAEQGAECFFRATGTVELWDPWTGEAQALHVAHSTPDGTVVRMPLGVDDAQLIVFTPGDPGPRVTETTLQAVTAVEESDGHVTVRGFTTVPGTHSATVQVGERTVEVQGEAPAPPPDLALDGPWEFELVPTMDNRWGDFRLPISEMMIGPEARRLRYHEESGDAAEWWRPDLDDSDWSVTTVGFGPRLMKLGPLPEEYDADELEADLLPRASAGDWRPVTLDEDDYAWEPYVTSWRWGVEGDPGPQGYHGLKEQVSDGFLVMEPNSYFATSVIASAPTTARVLTGGLRPAAVWLNGRLVPPKAETLELIAGENRLLLRYDSGGRDWFVLQSADAAGEHGTYPLAMRWYTLPGVLPYDPSPEASRTCWYRFTAPPGLTGFSLWVIGALGDVWVDGEAASVQAGDERADGARAYEVTPSRVSARPVTVALRVEQAPGYRAGAALPESIILTCAPGELEAGDWSQVDGLSCYSGGARYRKRVSLSAEQMAGRVSLDLGAVIAAADVRVNGQLARTLVAPPWRADISEYVREGENEIEVFVCNTLANHYSTIPTAYGGPLTSGLLGPVKIETEVAVTLAGTSETDGS